VNERNVTISASDGYEHQFTELEEFVDIKERYRGIRAKIGRRAGKDNRITKQLYAKYGKRGEGTRRRRLQSFEQMGGSEAVD
jgi:hypothetical protein